MIFETKNLSTSDSFRLLVGSIVPRAIAWVSTVSVSGVANLAPISFFTGVGREPPMVSLTLMTLPDGFSLKDTLKNIKETGEFVVNFASLAHAAELHITSGDFPSDVDEFEAAGLGKEFFESGAVPRVKGTPIAMQCQLDRIIQTDAYDHVVFGRVTRFYVRDDLYLQGGRIDIAALGVVGRLAGEYSLVTNSFVTPLDSKLLDQLLNTRAVPLDEQGIGSGNRTDGQARKGALAKLDRAM